MKEPTTPNDDSRYIKYDFSRDANAISQDLSSATILTAQRVNVRSRTDVVSVKCVLINLASHTYMTVSDRAISTY